MFNTPNSVHLTGDTQLHHHFGAIQYVKARPLCAHPHVDVRCEDHVKWELSPEFAWQLVQQVTRELAELGFVPEIHDAYIEEEG